MGCAGKAGALASFSAGPNLPIAGRVISAQTIFPARVSEGWGRERGSGRPFMTGREEAGPCVG